MKSILLILVSTATLFVGESAFGRVGIEYGGGGGLFSPEEPVIGREPNSEDDLRRPPIPTTASRFSLVIHPFQTRVLWLTLYSQGLLGLRDRDDVKEVWIFEEYGATLRLMVPTKRFPLILEYGLGLGMFSFERNSDDKTGLEASGTTRRQEVYQGTFQNQRWAVGFQWALNSYFYAGSAFEIQRLDLQISEQYDVTYDDKISYAAGVRESRRENKAIMRGFVFRLGVVL